MKKFFVVLVASAAMAALATAAYAADRVYDNGSVWVVSFIETKPGHFDDYMKFLATTFRAENDELKKKGYVLDYKVFNITDPRDHEPDLVLAIEYKNMAAFDIPLDEQEAMTKKLFGSLSASDKAMIERGGLRELRGSTMMRELKFTK